VNAAAGLLAALALALPAPHAASHGVAVRDNAFSPGRVTIRKGSSVTWSWRGRHRHNVFIYSGPSGRPHGCSTRRRGRCTLRFRRRGRYRYVCTLHGSMAGVIRVR
jgi:plastocyanin